MIGVTGGTGFVGRCLVPLLAKQDQVRVFAADESLTPQPEVSYLKGNLLSSESTEQFVSGCSSIVHMAGIAHTNLRTAAEKELAVAVNVEGTRTVVDAALKYDVKRFVFVSTAHVYHPLEGIDISEMSPITATSVYAETKIRAEEIVREAGTSGMETVIVRPCLIYGPGARFNLWRMMRGIDRGYYFHLTRVNPLRSFLSLENAARALCHLAQNHVPAGSYNLADESPYSLRGFADELAARMGRPMPRVVPHSLVSTASKIGGVLKVIGIDLRITPDTVRKLSANFTLDTRALASTGFVWDSDTGKSRQEMVDEYLRSKG